MSFYKQSSHRIPHLPTALDGGSLEKLKCARRDAGKVHTVVSVEGTQDVCRFPWHPHGSMCTKCSNRRATEESKGFFIRIQVLFSYASQSKYKAASRFSINRISCV